MPTSPLTGSRVPDLGYAADVAAIVTNAITDVEGAGIPRFPDTSARAAAYTAWVDAGGTMTDGLHCYVTGIGDQVYFNGGWRLASGLGAHAIQTSGFAANDTEARVTGSSNWTGPLVTGRTYQVAGQGTFSTDTAGNFPEVRLRGARGATPTGTSQVLAVSRGHLPATNRYANANLFGTFGVATTGSHTLSLFLRRLGGAGTVTLGAGDSGIFEYTVTDIGPYESGVPLIP